MIDALELAQHFPTDALTPALLQRSVALGLIELTDDDRVRVPDRRFLDTGTDLAKLGVPLDVVLDEWEHLIAQTDDIAERFVRVFETHLLPADWRRDLDAERVRGLAATLAHLQHDAGQVLLAALDASVAKIGAQRLAELVPPTHDEP